MKRLFSLLLFVIVSLTACAQSGGGRPEPPAQTAQQAAPPLTYAEALAAEALREGVSLTGEEEALARDNAARDARQLILLGEERSGLVERLTAEYIQEATEWKLIEKLYPDLNATDEEVSDWYDTRLEALRKAFEKDPGAYKNQQDSFELYGGVPPLVIPEGYVRIKHILVEEEALANALYGRLGEGEAFEALLAEYGTDAGMREEPYLSKGYLTSGHESAMDLLPQMKAAALSLRAPGDYSPVVKSDAGYHIILLLEKLEAREMPLNEAYAHISGILTRAKRQAAFQEYMDKAAAD